MTEEYIRCVATCTNTDYSVPSMVRAHNKAVESMYEIIDGAVAEGEDSVALLASLLDHPAASRWIAHQLVERGDLKPDIRVKCITIVKEFAAGDDTDAMGERIWLDEWEHKKGV